MLSTSNSAPSPLAVPLQSQAQARCHLFYDFYLHQRGKNDQIYAEVRLLEYHFHINDEYGDSVLLSSITVFISFAIFPRIVKQYIK